MKLISIPIKNIFGNIWRSFTFGTFIFFGVIVIIFTNSFLMTAKSNMEDSFINALVGHVQIRSSRSKEEDMFSFKRKLGDIEKFSSEEAGAIGQMLNKTGYSDYTMRIRHNAMLISDKAKDYAMTIGLDLKSSAYQKSFTLSKGRYLDPTKSNEILLSEEIANNLKVKPGDTIGALSQTKEGYTVDAALVVAGIGTVNNLSLFGFVPAYMSIQTARELIGYGNGEVTDIIVYNGDKNKSAAAIKKLDSALRQADLSEIVKLSTWKSMGGFVMGIVDFYRIWFYGFILFLMIIISILITNLVLMMGMERRQEIGTIRAIGYSRIKTISFFMSEILSVTVIFSILGVIVGTTAVVILGKVGLTFDYPTAYMFGMHFYLKPDINQIISALIIIFVFTVLASLYPSYKATKVRPAEVLQEM